jgi:hypothetical protein
MNLNLSKLERVHHRGRKTIARCPACAESEHDYRGEHLIINEDGKFGCVVYPGNSPDARAHRKRIFALCGIRKTIQPLIVKKDVSHTAKEPPYIIWCGQRDVPSVPTGTLGRRGRISPYTSLYTERGKQSEPPAHPLLKQSEPESVPNVPTVPALKLKERTTGLYPCELDWLNRWCGPEGDPSIIFGAVRLFNAKIVRIERR